MSKKKKSCYHLFLVDYFVYMIVVSSGNMGVRRVAIMDFQKLKFVLNYVLSFLGNTLFLDILTVMTHDEILKFLLFKVDTCHGFLRVAFILILILDQKKFAVLPSFFGLGEQLQVLSF
ncbi:hypothetical protein BCR42DRAFT_409419 [Absidia repens]|uniref:Uncharacterized protein n=1 Tax=Absidia repens TaxID=90262 RepID=A0A1X2ISP1_9FUNG|nr:hypothetical protein BCR42DRAFT_409419 [Absidia repens]